MRHAEMRKRWYCKWKTGTWKGQEELGTGKEIAVGNGTTSDRTTGESWTGHLGTEKLGTGQLGTGQLGTGQLETGQLGQDS